MRNKRISGLYAVTPETPDTDWLAARVEAVLAGGARVVQYRNKSADRQLRGRQAGRLLGLCRAHRALLIVNDDVDLARALDADGVHLGREDQSLAAARAALGAGRLLGVSCYDSLARALAARELGADYVAFGSFFPSSIKPEAVRAPVELLRAARAALELPIVAIGGITPDNGAALLDAGADGLAVISALFGVPDSLSAAQSFAGLFAAAHASQSIQANR
jgi:thiamine-phosphate pyrophosphorylase